MFRSSTHTLIYEILTMNYETKKSLVITSLVLLCPRAEDEL